MKGIKSSHAIVLCKIYEDSLQHDPPFVKKDQIIQFLLAMLPKERQILDLDLSISGYESIIRHLKENGYITSRLTRSTPPSAEIQMTEEGIEFLKINAAFFEKIGV